MSVIRWRLRLKWRMEKAFLTNGKHTQIFSQIKIDWFNRYLDMVTISVCRYKDGPYSDWDNSLKWTVQSWVDGDTTLIRIHHRTHDPHRFQRYGRLSMVCLHNAEIQSVCLYLMDPLFSIRMSWKGNGLNIKIKINITKKFMIKNIEWINLICTLPSLNIQMHLSLEVGAATINIT